MSSALSDSSKRLLTLLRSIPWLSRRRHGSLVVHLMLLAFLWGVSIYLFAIAGLWWTSERLIHDSLNQQSQHWLDKLDELGTTLLISGDASYFEPIRKHVASFPEVAHLSYIAADGRTVIASYNAPGRDPQLFPALSPTTLQNISAGAATQRYSLSDIEGSSLLRATGAAMIKSIPNDGMLEVDLNRDVRESSRLIGYIDLGLDVHSYHENLERNILYGSGLILLLFLGTTLIGRFIILRALRPLADLQLPLAKLAQGDTDIEVASEGATEIAAIGQALNTTITALRERDRELKRLAIFDTLTGLYNRHSFNHALEREKARILLDGRCSALLFIDLDRFKEVNDTAGHAAGDELLLQVARLLKDSVREDDVVARLGGDEFTVILKDADQQAAEQVATHICRALGDFVFTADEHAFRIQCSIGITIIDAEKVLPSTVLSQADTACHEAKKQGRNCHVLFSSIDSEDVLHLQQTGVREQIVNSLIQNEFVLVFLPVIDSQSRTFRYLDASVRMHSSSGEIPAGAFLAAAERFDLINQVDRQVILMAARQLAEAKDDRIRLALKISGRSLQQPDMLDYIRTTLTTAGVAPERIMLEIPERAILESVTQAKNFILGLRDLGCRVAIDDFGVSLNALSLLEGLPVQQLCIEGNLANSVTASSFNRTLVASFVSIAKGVGVQTLAKQVFREEEAKELTRIGIDLLQGQLLGPPRRSLELGAAAELFTA